MHSTHLPVMASKLKDIVAKDVKSLIKHLTGLEENEDNFKACERYLFSNIIHHRYLSVDSHALRRSYDGIVCKLKFHGLFEKANKLDELVKAFLENKEYKDHPTFDIQWALLSFLLHSANNPSGNADFEEESVTEDQTFRVSLEALPTTDEIVDWEAYLREGDCDFQASWSDCTISDLSDSDSDKESGITSLTTGFERVNASSIPPSPAKQPIPRSGGVDMKQQRKEIFRLAAEAEKWCRENLQPSWWTDAHITHEPETIDPTSKLAFLWHESQKEVSKIHTKPVVTDTISEHKVVLEVLWMLASPSTSPLFLATADFGTITFTVRSQITLPSLSQDVFSDIMTEMCSYFGMVSSLQDFSHKVLSDDLSHLPPATYNAYATALRKARQPLLDKIIELEKQAHKQEVSLSLTETLQALRPRLKDLEILYALHQRAVLPWDSNPNWLCAIHMLAVLLSELSCARKNASLILPIVVSAMQGYVDIADLWFATGVLDDCRDEFIIVKSEESSCEGDQSRDTLCMRPWEKYLRDRNLAIPEILKMFASKMLSAGRDIEILRRMDRLREIWRITPTRGNFVTEVMVNLNKTIKKYNIEDSNVKENELEGEVMTTSAVTEPLTPRTIPTHLRILNDPFLDVLLIESLRSSECSEKVSAPIELFKESLSRVPNSFPISSWLRESLIAQLDDRWKCGQIGCTAANILTNELQLDRHIRFAQSLFLMQAGNILEPFCKILFMQADREMKQSYGMPSLWESIYSLSVILEDSVDAEHQDLSSRCSLNQRPVVFKEKRSPAVTDSLDTLELSYSVDWPLTLVLSPQNIDRYNQIFRLLVKIKWGVWALLQMRFSDVRANMDHPLIKRVMHLRVWLLHALSTSFTFLAGQILNNLWESFLKKMKTAKDLESFVRAHNDFLEAVHDQCLQPSKPDVIKNSLLQMVVIADKLRTLWKDNPEKISKSALHNMERCYIDCHAYLVEFLRCQDDNYKHLAYLCEVFTQANPLDVFLD